MAQEKEPDRLRRRYPQGEGHHGEEIADGPGPVPVEQALAQQDDVACLSVGKDSAPAEVGVCILQPAGKGEQGHGKQPLGGGMGLLVHRIRSFS